MSTENNKNYSLLILAGGKSSRMGRDKATLLYEGKTFLENLVVKGNALGMEKIYVSNFRGECEGVSIVYDVFPERGPLGGMHACMKQIQTPYCLVLPVDVPQIPLEVLEKLLEFHKQYCKEQGTKEKIVPVLLEHGERRENLIGIYPTECVDCIEDLIREQSASVYKLLSAWGFLCCKMEIPEWQVDNINTQEAYQKLLS